MGDIGKEVGGPTDIRYGKLNKVVSAIDVKKTSVNKASGSRFEILCEDMEVMIPENIGQSKVNSGGCSKANGKGILTESTNQKEFQSGRSTKNNQYLDSRVQKKSKVQIPNPNTSETRDDGMQDNASVLRQFHKEVKDFEDMQTGNSSLEPNGNNCDLTNTPCKDSPSIAGERFDLVASKLGEAMAGISE
ncbi:hypothetical protein LWI29_009946 [Acer saccharum]|uniref:Uncharacterized protein n=1 Tax=Acer saccharum TaxID=4024 RepID=A0AA39VGD0_ACESA|nr:hypothetical protein LWI29_009946 [Acer saccharum]